MTSFKNKFASLIADLRESKKAVVGTKFTEFTKQPYPAYDASLGEAPPPPPPATATNTTTTTTTTITTTNARPPSRSGSIRAGLRKMSSRTSLRRKGSHAAGGSTSEVDKAGIPPMPQQHQQQQQQPQQVAQIVQNVELTPPPSGGRTPPPAMKPYDNDPYDEDEYLYGDPTKKKETQKGALPQLQTMPAAPSAPVPPPQQQPYNADQASQFSQLPRMIIPRTNSSVLATIPASPATLMGSPTTPNGTNPFRKLTPSSPNLKDIADGPFKPQGLALDTISMPANRPAEEDDIPEAASPNTATARLMNGIAVSFFPPPNPATIPIPSPVTPPVTFADNNPFKDLAEPAPAPAPQAQSRIKAIAPPSQSAPITTKPRSRSITPPPIPARTPSNGAPLKQPQYKRAPTALKTKAPEGFAPPPPPPMMLPQGWTARWDDTEKKFAYYQGTRGKSEQWEMPTEPAKKMSIKDKRADKKKAVAANMAKLPSYDESSSPTGSVPKDTFPVEKGESSKSAAVVV